MENNCRAGKPIELELSPGIQFPLNTGERKKSEVLSPILNFVSNLLPT